MAYITFTDRWLCDPRREALAVKVGVLQADGVALRAWRLGFEYFKNDQAVVPNQVFDSLPHAKEFIDVGLAERTISGTYIRGSKDEFKWYFEMKLQASRAGKISAQRPRDAKGRLLPKTPNEGPTGIQQALDNQPTESNEVQLSSLLFSSKEENTLVLSDNNTSELDFEKLYQEYPKREGSQNKKAGLKTCEKRFSSREKYDELLGAIRNYAKHCAKTGKTGTQYVAQFSTFVNGLWEEFVALTPSNRAGFDPQGFGFENEFPLDAPESARSAS